LQEACTKFGNGQDKNAVAAGIPLLNQAVNNLTTAHEQNTNNAEILTYKNNAEVYRDYAIEISQSTQKPNRPKILAVAIPVNPRNSSLKEEIKESADGINLGVAIAQKEFNQKNNHKFIVFIADDKNDTNTAEPIINSLKKVQPEIVGVVGHAFSSLTINAVNFYNKNKLVLISPTSTAVNIRPGNLTDGEIIYSEFAPLINQLPKK
jgi:hypothetical protein